MNFKKLSKKLMAVSMLVLSIFVLTACNGDGGSGSSVDIGIVLPSRDLPRWLQDETRFVQALQDTPYSVEILFSQDSSARERENVETLITRGMQVLIIATVDSVGATAAVEAAQREGITVIAYDRLITGTDAIDFYVTFDSFAVGQAQGQFLIDNATGTGNPLFIYAGSAADNNAFIFFEGAWSVLQPRIADGTFIIQNSSEAVALQNQNQLTREEKARIIGQITTNWVVSDARNLAEANLTAVGSEGKGDVFILAPNDGSAMAISDTFAQDSEITSIVITGQDAEQSSIQYIIDGRQSMTVFKDVRLLVEDAIEMAVTILDGGNVVTDSFINNEAIDVPTKQTAIAVVDRYNLIEKLIESGFYEADNFDFTNLQ